MIAVLAERMDEAAGAGVFPGAVLWVQRRGRCLHASAHGKCRTDEPGEDVGLSTCFDLASLTKILSATSLMMLACDEHALNLKDKVSEHLPGFSDAGVSLAHLLEHSSGLAAWRAYYEEIAAAAGGSLLATVPGRDALRAMVLAERARYAPGERAEYSDLGFILLDWILEKRFMCPCDELFAERVAGPLGLDDLFFIDLKDPGQAQAARQGRIFAATERCPWRGRTLVAEVHDDNTYAMGGVSGHAGLFGAASSVAALAQSWLDAWAGRGSIFSKETLRRFWTPSDVPGSSRCLGFDRPAPEGSQAGRRLGPKTVGHLGFTGCSLWLDPEAELFIILLSNRVHPSRDHEGIKEFRAVIHDRVMEACSR